MYPVEQFYEPYHDRIADECYNSPDWPRRHTQRQIFCQYSLP